MIRVRSGPRPGPAHHRRVLVVLATLIGLVFMHQLGGPPPHGHHDHAAHRTAVTHCDCPDVPHGHPGQVCQAKPPHSSTGVPAPATALPPSPATPDRPLTLSTADGDAAGGSGCGPPARALLSVWLI
jgi:hypothetical protein